MGYFNYESSNLHYVNKKITVLERTAKSSVFWTSEGWSGVEDSAKVCWVSKWLFHSPKKPRVRVSHPSYSTNAFFYMWRICWMSRPTEDIVTLQDLVRWGGEWYFPAWAVWHSPLLSSLTPEIPNGYSYLQRKLLYIPFVMIVIQWQKIWFSFWRIDLCLLLKQTLIGSPGWPQISNALFCLNLSSAGLFVCATVLVVIHIVCLKWEHFGSGLMRG